MFQIGTCLRGAVRVVLRLLPVLLIGNAVGAADLRLITFGGATLTGSYYAFARAACEEINRAAPPNLRCSPEATSGSVYNLFALTNGELDFALVQSDWQRRAVEGTGPFAATGPMTGLRSVLSLYREALTLAVRRDAGIRRFEDLEGKVVDIGASTTARRGTVDRLIDALDLPDDFFADTRFLSGPSVANELCAGRVDATLIVYGHPSGAVRNLVDRCDLMLISIDGPKIDAFLEANADYSRYTIPAGTYPGMNGPVETFSVSAALLTREDVPDDVVALYATTIIGDYEHLRSLVPVLPPVLIEQSQREGLTAPLHPGVAGASAAAAAQ